MSDLELTFTVTDDEAGQRLDRILAARLGDLSRHRIQKALAAELVTVAGRVRPKSFRPASGAEVVATIPPEPWIIAAAEDIPLDIIYEDEHILVVNKAPDMVVHPAVGHRRGTLVNALMHRGQQLAETGDPLRPGIVHRLDRETSGLLVVARTAVAHRHLTRQLKERTLGRVYLALSWGTWSDDRGTLQGSIARHPRDRLRMAVVETGGREATTHYEVIDDLSFVQLCRVRLETGRTHQIRVHYTHHGHPVVGDPLYGDDQRALNVAPVDRRAADRLVHATRRQLLHAAELHLVHPADGCVHRFRAPLAADFAAALRGLRTDLGRPPVEPETDA